MALSIAGRNDSFHKFAQSRFALKHLFVIEADNEGVEMPSLFAFRGEFPYLAVQTFPYEKQNSNNYYPEIVDVDDVTVEFYETENNLSYAFFTEWQTKVMVGDDPTVECVFALEKKYKKNLYVYRLAPIGSPEFNKVFGLHYTGVFPKSISPMSVDMTDPNVLTYTVTFSCDSVKRLKSGLSSPRSKTATVKQWNPVIDKDRSRQLPIQTGNPVEGVDKLVETFVQTGNPVEGVDKLVETFVQTGNIADGIDKQHTYERGTENPVEGVDKEHLVKRENGVWIKALLTAAAKTGINIAERKAFYEFYLATGKSKIFGEAAMGIGETRGIIRGL